MLGALAMIDGGEVDWKIIAIRAADPVADAVSGTFYARCLSLLFLMA